MGSRMCTFLNLTSALSINPDDPSAKTNLILLSLDAQIYTLRRMSINFPDHTIANLLKKGCKILKKKDSGKYIIDPKNIFILDGYKVRFFNLVTEWRE